jgi:hypothetical protein
MARTHAVLRASQYRQIQEHRPRLVYVPKASYFYYSKKKRLASKEAQVQNGRRHTCDVTSCRFMLEQLSEISGVSCFVFCCRRHLHA